MAVTHGVEVETISLSRQQDCQWESWNQTGSVTVTTRVISPVSVSRSVRRFDQSRGEDWKAAWELWDINVGMWTGSDGFICKLNNAHFL